MLAAQSVPSPLWGEGTSSILQRNHQLITLRRHHHAKLATRLSTALHTSYLLDIAQTQRPTARLAVARHGNHVTLTFCAQRIDN